jgi:hypothetical protein
MGANESRCMEPKTVSKKNVGIKWRVSKIWITG